MKTTIALAAGLLSLGVVSISPAAAYHLTPTGPFTADGTTSATKGGLTLPCNAHFVGTIDSDGIAHITSGNFTDNGAVGCTAVTLNKLPWSAPAITKGRIRINRVNFSTPIGNCGTGNIPAPLKNGVLTFTAVPLKPDCSVSGSLTTSPTISIVP